MEAVGKVVVVTGGGSGIGRALCVLCAKRGAKAVVSVDYSRASAQATSELVQKICGGSCLALAMQADCGQEVDMFRCIDHVEREVGPIGIFIANAGVGPLGHYGIGSTDREWKSAMDVNFMQHVYWARHLLPRMVARGGGYVVVTSSAAGLLTQVNGLTYAVSKAAAVALAEWIAITHGDDGIGVSCLCPQAVATNLYATTRRYAKGDAGPLVSAPSPKLPPTPPSSSSALSAAAAAPASPQSIAKPAVEKEVHQGNAAGVDGVMTAEKVAELTLQAMQAGEFLVLPHKSVLEYTIRKATDRTRWVKGMRRLNKKFGKQAVMEGRVLQSKL